ncbi:MAG TPA: hypothetical protein VGS20_07195 [Candidatus Acidoferrales bacterium]|nr:hypothetical protein [Candidatus Acidoferrales bacterium]
MRQADLVWHLNGVRGFRRGISKLTPELQRALRRHVQWFGSYKRSGELAKVQVWLVLNRGSIEFITGANSYKVKRARRNPKVICFVGRPNGPAISGAAEILSDQREVWRVYRAYWRTHPIRMALLLGLRLAAAIAFRARVVVRVQPDQPNPLAG